MIHIDRIVIEKLYGYLTYDIRLKENKLILVAENGAGKTTIVNIIYYFLSRQWEKLSSYNLEAITAYFGAQSISLKKSELLQFTKIRRLKARGISRHLSVRHRVAIDQILGKYEIEKLINDHLELDRISSIYDLPPGILYDVISDIYRHDSGPLFDGNFKNKEAALKTLIDVQILYLPTYRRIEHDLKSIFPDIQENIDFFNRKRVFNDHPNNVYLELVEFGMEDVEQKVSQVTSELSLTFNSNLLSGITGSYLRDVINRKYLENKLEEFKDITVEVLDVVLERIDSKILQETEKKKLREFVTELRQNQDKLRNDDKVIAHFIYQLVIIYIEQRDREKDIEEFVKVCNSYIANKVFNYNPISYQLQIMLTGSGQPIKLKDLSSGEKQIVSLFSHLYLSKEKKFFLIIDEPELSLSVKWQERFLVDITNAEYCAGLLSVTHSPFIFDNQLDAYTHSLDEFLQTKSS